MADFVLFTNILFGQMAVFDHSLIDIAFCNSIRLK